jgi:hypothetical protein
MNLSKNVKITRVVDYTTAGTTTLTGTVDMSGYDGVVFIAYIATANSANYGKAGGGAASDGSDASDYAGSKTYTASGKNFILDVYRPTDRYVTYSQVLGSSSAVYAVYAIQYQGNYGAIDNAVASTTAAVLVADPVAGTA